MNRAPALTARSRATLTFLFADLRNFTPFVEEHGDADAAMVIEAYRRIVRHAVSRHEGAEIKTEGDSFYVVFKTARQAVDCAIAIMHAADAYTRANPELPISLGIGIHAGEPVPQEHQYVGSAVIIAARLGQGAVAGEILISDIVRGLLRTSGLPPLAERTGLVLKGVAEAPRVFAVDWATAAYVEGSRRSQLRLPALIGMAAFAFTIVVIVAALAAGSRPGPAATPLSSVALPSHGPVLFDATFTPSGATRLRIVQHRPNEDRVRWLGDAVEITAAVGSWVALEVEDLAPDDFIADLSAQPANGQGTFAFFFRGSEGRQLQFQVAPVTGEVAIQVVGGFEPGASQRLFGPASRLPPTHDQALGVIMSAHGADLVADYGGREAARASDPAPHSGAVGFLVTASSDRPFTVRLTTLRIYGP
jgi:class 3 adenylate cyclase